MTKMRASPAIAVGVLKTMRSIYLELDLMHVLCIFRKKTRINERVSP